MRKALVLAGGGTRGSYQNGAVRALRELGQDDWNIVCGTSIGALNGALIVQKDYEMLDSLWHGLTQETIFAGAFPDDLNLETLVSERNLLTSFFRNYVKERGADITPLIENIHRVFVPERFFASDVDYGCITVASPSLKPVYVTKEMMRENGADWLVASASAFPVFPACRIGDTEYIDGGYFDNLPIDFALRKGAEEVIVIDLHTTPKHPSFVGRPHIRYIFPQTDTGRFLEFSREKIDLLETLGYNDTMKSYGRYDGVKYTFCRRYPLPEWFDEWYLDLLMLETRIRIASRVAERIYSESAVTDRIRSKQHVPFVDERRLYWGMMDALMDLSGCETGRVYTKKEAVNSILAAFAEAADEHVMMIPSGGVREILDYARTLDEKGIVIRILHGLLYPEQMLFPENIRLTIYPFEEALARFLKYMMLELGGKK